MKYFRSYLLGILLFVFIQSCTTAKTGDLEPASKLPVYSIKVEDATEAAILEQELKLQILKLEGNQLYYSDEKGAMGDRLVQFGYDRPTKEDPYQVNKTYRMLLLKSVKDSLPALAAKLKELKLSVINQEKDHWVLYGSLAALQQVQSKGYQLAKLNYELRPREIKVEVESREDIQKIANLGVDIFSSASSQTRRIIIVEGSAFDHQIEEIRKMGFTVTIVKQKI